MGYISSFKKTTTTTTTGELNPYRYSLYSQGQGRDTASELTVERKLRALEHAPNNTIQILRNRCAPSNWLLELAHTCTEAPQTPQNNAISVSASLRDPLQQKMRLQFPSGYKDIWTAPPMTQSYG